MRESFHFDIFTDGSSLIKGDFYESSSGVCIFHDGDLLFECGEYYKGGTNSLGEMTAVKLALDEFKKFLEFNKLKPRQAHISLYSDSDYVVKSLTEYIRSWKKQGDCEWVGSKGNKVAHQKIIKKIYYKYLNDPDWNINMYHIHGHIGDKISKQVAYKKFIKRNKIDISYDRFEYLVCCNGKVDRVADIVRRERYGFYKRNGDTKWETNYISPIDKDMISGLVRIRPRRKIK